MPFIGKDWRSPGEAWVKTESSGWQRMKIIESQLRPAACHQYHNILAACSWPPPSQMGQHMAANCGRNSNAKKQETGTIGEGVPSGHCSNATSTGSTQIQCQASTATRGRQSGSIVGDLRADCAPFSPIGSPERGLAHQHHQAITISSPYGRYSCCQHHLQQPVAGSPPSCCCCSQRSTLKTSSSQFNLDQMPTGLSGESHSQGGAYSPGDDDISTNCSTSADSTASQPADSSDGANLVSLSSTSSKPPVSRPALRSSSSSQTSASTECEWPPEVARLAQSNLTRTSSGGDKKTTAATELGGSPEASVPVILENGQRICDSSAGELESSSKQETETAKDYDYHGRLAPPRQASVSPETGISSGSSSSSSGVAASCCYCACSGGDRQRSLTPASIEQESSCPSTGTVSASELAKNNIPHCRVSVRTREVAMYNTISEAFYRLDFYNAIHDIRRFNYICKLLHLLVTENLTSLSGCATKVLFAMLEQVAWEVNSNKRNIHVIKNLLNELKDSIEKYYCWGRPIGSSLLWQQHFDTIDRISRIVDDIEPGFSGQEQQADDSTSNNNQQQQQQQQQITFDRLPKEMVREVLLRLNDYRDLISSAQASPIMQSMIDEQYIWKKLCLYHFSEQQLKLVLESDNKYLRSVKRSTLRGIKYAKRSTADGKASYRNPVAHRRAKTVADCEPPSSSSPPSPAECKTEHSQRSAAGSNSNCSLGGAPRRQTRHDSLSGGSGSDSDCSPKCSSPVVKAIRMFDREAPTSPRAHHRGSSSASSGSSLAAGGGSGAGSLEPSWSRESEKRAGQSGDRSAASSTNGSSCSPATEVDWELVFHQLRRRFDLKEEYADCLLLCRHCRCLFWKSIGHPCIKNDDERTSSSFQTTKQSAQDGGPANQSRPDSAPIHRDRRASRPSLASQGFSLPSGRPSVASLSRTFDVRSRAEETENVGRMGASSNRRPSAGEGAPSRQPLGARRNLQQDANRLSSARPNGDNDPMINSSQNRQSRPMNREELVPKHITITPQAFLKFFSL